MEGDSKKTSLLSRLRSTLDKEVKFLQKRRYIQSPAGKLPQELAENIIDHLWYHFDSLLACCLTCKGWVEPSRYHLFYRRRLIYEHQYKSLAILRRHGLIDYIRRIELDLLPPFSNKSPTFRYLKDMGTATSLRALVLTEYNLFHIPDTTRLAQATFSLVTLELTHPGGSPNDILQFICMFPNLDNLSVDGHSESTSYSTPRYGNSPSFRGVLTLKRMNCFGKDGVAQGLINVPGGLRFRRLVLKCNVGAEPLISACSETLRTLFYQPRSEADVDLDFYDLSKHLLLETIETVACSKTSAVPPTYLEHLTSKISSPNFRDLFVTTHDHDFGDLRSILSTTAERVTSNLLARGNRTSGASTTRAKATFNIEDPLWSSRNKEELVQEICPAILEETEVVVVAQKRNLSWGSVCHDQAGVDPMALMGLGRDDTS